MARQMTGFMVILLLGILPAVPLSAAEHSPKDKAAHENQEPSACDGAEQPACNDSRDFCRKAAGYCNDPDTPGVCTRPTNECTEEYEPVCGCDGVNYTNECWAHAEGINIAFYDECEDGD